MHISSLFRRALMWSCAIMRSSKVAQELSVKGQRMSMLWCSQSKRLVLPDLHVVRVRLTIGNRRDVATKVDYATQPAKMA